MSYSKFLFVGLGGSGGKTLRFLKREINRWMQSHDVDMDIPQGWQFLHIDTPIAADGQEIDHLADPLAAGEYLGLITNPGLDIPQVQAALDNRTALLDEMRGWRVEPAGLGVPLAQGAGQFRAVGQTLAMAFAKTIHNKLNQCKGRLQNQNATAELDNLFQAVEGRPAGAKRNTYVVVVSSLAGGTGAGLLNQTCDMLRAMNIAGDSIFAVLYTPEVFDVLNANATGGVHPNSLAAISEMLNGQWLNAGRDDAPAVAEPKINPVLVDVGLPEPQVRSGPTFPFLVGRTGTGGIDFGTPDRLFEMMSRSLVSWMTDLVVHSKFVAFIAGNWQQAAMNRVQGQILVDAGDDPEVGRPCLSALGFSRLSVGGEHFERYAQERLVKDALMHLTRCHIDGAEAKAIADEIDHDDREVILDRIVANHLRKFLHDARLTRIGPEDDEIIDDLRPARQDALKRTFLQQARQNAGIGSGDRHDVEQWRQQVKAAVDAGRRPYEIDYRRELDLSTESWIGSVSERIVTAVEERIGLYGLRVAAELCAQSGRYLKEERDPDLRENDARRYRHWASQAEVEIDEALETARGKLPSDDERLEAAVLAGVNYAAFTGDEMLAVRAAQLAVQVAEKIFEPLKRALLQACEIADDEAEDLVDWPNWDNLPPAARVRPPAGEFSLIEPDEYPHHFTDLFNRSIGGADLAQDKRNRIRSLLVTGSFVDQVALAGDLDLKRCLTVNRGWFPAEINSVQPAVRLGISLATSVDDFKARAKAWLRVPGSAFEGFIDCSIRDYVGDPSDEDRNPVQERDHQARFLAQLNAAMRAAAPLISIDAGLINHVHPGAAGSLQRLQFSVIPLAAHPLEKEVRGLLQNAGIDDADIGDVFAQDTSVDHISITSALDAPVSPLVVESLLSPIAARWNAAKQDGQGATQTFWSNRRAQPLAWFIPAPQALIRCMVRGWFTGRLLGLIKQADIEGGWSVADSRDKPYRRFSPDMLGQPHDKEFREALPLLLEALSLAYVDASRLNSLAPLEPYIALRELGRSRPNGALYNYRSLTPVLAQWVADGQFHPEGVAEAQIKSAAEAGGGRPADRLRVLATCCREIIASYEKRYVAKRAEWHEQPALLGEAPRWASLWVRHMGPALNDIVLAADAQASDLDNDTEMQV